MATQTVLNAQSTDTTSSSVTLSGPCSVIGEGDFNSATASIEISTDDSTFEPLTGPEGVFRRPSQFTCNVLGTYYLRAVQAGSKTGDDAPSITVKTTQ